MFRRVCVVALAVASSAFAGESRDIVFDCPCRGEWTAGPDDGGRLTLDFGVRSHRATDSGDIRLVSLNVRDFTNGQYSESWSTEVESAPSLGSVAGGIRLSGERRVLRSETPTTGEAIAVLILERLDSRAPQGGSESEWEVRDVLALWPLATIGGDSIELVDLLADADGDGVGDVNERLAGTSPTDVASRPEVPSTIDVLALYSAGFREKFGGYPETRIHHLMTLTDALFADSGTNIRVRTVGMSDVALEEDGWPVAADREELLERHGADLSLMFHGCEVPNYRCSSFAALGGSRLGGYWDGNGLFATVTWGSRALFAAHELGHNLGLVHSDRQGETHGAFRWSRGHYVNATRGTIMSYGGDILGGVFSDPGADCLGRPCGVSGTEPAGANAVRSLDLVRWQAAAHRASKPDADGDGIVDAGDALPNDPAEYVDSDGDGIGDNADDDDDNDGVADGEDAFPVDPAEWADADGDGIGDNTDENVANLDPFRDPALRAAVEAALGKVPGDPIAEAELLTLTTLSAPLDAGIRDLTGLEVAENLEVLRLDGNQVEDLSPLAELDRLRKVSLLWNRVSDLTPLARNASIMELNVSLNPISDLGPLADLSALRYLDVSRSRISDLGPLADLSALRYLDVSRNPISDLTPLAELSSLRTLYANELGITDLAFLSQLTELVALHVRHNPVTDLSVLRQLAKLGVVDVEGTNVDDLSPLSDLNLLYLNVGSTRTTLDDLLALPNSRELIELRIGKLGLESEDLGSFSEFRQLVRLGLSNNRISDLSPLGTLRGLRRLDAGGNEIVDIGPLVQREIWHLESDYAPYLSVRLNPLNRASLHDHIPKLEAWGINVFAPDSPAVSIPDPALHRLVSRAIAGISVHVDDPIIKATIMRLRRLDAFNAGVSDLTGLEEAKKLRRVFLGSNGVSDLSPFGDLPELAVLDLADNLISDLSPLVGNPAVAAGDSITLDGNPLSEESLNTHVPALLERGVQVSLDSVRLRAPLDGGAVVFRVSGYFAALVGPNATIDASSTGLGVAAAVVDGGRLRLTPDARGGFAKVTLTARGTNGTTATLTFFVSFVERPRALADLPPVALVSEGETVEIGLAELFAGDGTLTFGARSSDPALVTVEVSDGVLTVRIVGDGDGDGTVTVTVTATDVGGLTGTLTFEVGVERLRRSLLQRGWFRALLELQRHEADAGG